MRSRRARGLVILGGLALAAILAGPLPAAAGNVSAIAGGVPAIVNPALPAAPRVPPALVGPDPIYQRGSLGQDRPRDRHQHGQRPGTTVVVVTSPSTSRQAVAGIPATGRMSGCRSGPRTTRGSTSRCRPTATGSAATTSAGGTPRGAIKLNPGRGLLRRLLVPGRQRQGLGVDASRLGVDQQQG